jgi:hypothetical protein
MVFFWILTFTTTSSLLSYVGVVCVLVSVQKSIPERHAETDCSWNAALVVGLVHIILILFFFMLVRLVLTQSACRTLMQTPWRLTGSAIVFLGRRIACSFSRGYAPSSCVQRGSAQTFESSGNAWGGGAVLITRTYHASLIFQHTTNLCMPQACVHEAAACNMQLG